MRWAALGVLLLFAAGPVASQEEDEDDGGIVIDEVPPEEPEKPPERKPELPPGHPPPEKPPPKPEGDEAVPPTAENINRAIEHGVEWLKRAQLEDGSWGHCTATGKYGNPDDHSRSPCYVTGPTSFAIFTLASCEVPARDRCIKKGLDWLRKRYRKAGTKKAFRYSTYESASLILMFAAVHAPTGARRPSKDPKRRAPGTKFPEDDWLWMHERISHLTVGWEPTDGSRRWGACQNRNGGWRYWESSGDQDASATQFALLALREAVRAGYPLNDVAPNVWQDAAVAARSFQVAGGGFRYKSGYPWTAGMTAASVASLLICKEQMLLAKQGVPTWLDDSVGQGLAFMGEIFDVEQNRYQEGEFEHRSNYHYYHLYGLERVGVLSGKKEFGGKAWYPRGASWLLGQQQEDGHWRDRTCMDPEDVLGTCFALLFLKRATPPPAVTISRD